MGDDWKEKHWAWERKVNWKNLGDHDVDIGRIYHKLDYYNWKEKHPLWEPVDYYQLIIYDDGVDRNDDYDELSYLNKELELVDLGEKIHRLMKLHLKAKNEDKSNDVIKQAGDAWKALDPNWEKEDDNWKLDDEGIQRLRELRINDPDEQEYQYMARSMNLKDAKWS